tara:strand:+ start:66 stop:686 length:621 start_codon:yes stop_codon:yes gene_type:complete
VVSDYDYRNFLNNWSKEIVVPRQIRTAGSDQEIAELYELGEKIIGLTSGDLHSSLGGNLSVQRTVANKTTACNIDLGKVTTEQDSYIFASYCKILHRYAPWKGKVIVNSQLIAGRRLAPKAHPGDGHLELIESSLTFRQALLARRKAKLGDHLPHPDLKIKRVHNFKYDFEESKKLVIDNQFIGYHKFVEFEVLPHAITIIVDFRN